MKQQEWKCAGCGIVSEIMACECATDVLFHYSIGKMSHKVKIDPMKVAVCSLADRLAEKKAGHRSFPSLDAEINIGWVTEAERNMIVEALRRDR